jgi:hypothetical protein
MNSHKPKLLSNRLWLGFLLLDCDCWSALRFRRISDSHACILRSLNGNWVTGDWTFGGYILVPSDRWWGWSDVWEIYRLFRLRNSTLRALVLQKSLFSPWGFRALIHNCCIWWSSQRTFRSCISSWCLLCWVISRFTSIKSNRRSWLTVCIEVECNTLTWIEVSL